MGTTDQQNRNSENGLSSPDLHHVAPHKVAEQAPRDSVYDLRLDGPSSDRFYFDVVALSLRVLAEMNSRASAALDGYTQYVTAVLREPLRSRGEYALELLTVGMAIRLYGRVAASTPA